MEVRNNNTTRVLKCRFGTTDFKLLAEKESSLRTCKEICTNAISNVKLYLIFLEYLNNIRDKIFLHYH
jgi:hypothetical protein